MGLKRELAGIRFGKLIAIESVKKIERPKETYWKCLCDCGNESIVATKSLVCGNTKSCGCGMPRNKDFCKNGHPLDGKSNKQRFCTICHALSRKKYHDSERGEKAKKRWKRNKKENISNSYIADIVKLKIKEMPKEFLEIYRLKITLQREARNARN
jgi:hypothetical protein